MHSVPFEPHKVSSPLKSSLKKVCSVDMNEALPSKSRHSGDFGPSTKHSKHKSKDSTFSKEILDHDEFNFDFDGEDSSLSYVNTTMQSHQSTPD